MNWKRFAALLAFPLMAWAHGVPQSSAEKQIRDVLEQQAEAWNRADLHEYMQGYWNSADLTFYSGGTVSSGWQGAYDRYRRRYQSEGRTMGRLTFSDLRIELLSSESAYVRGKWRLQMPDGSRPGGLFTLIFRKRSEGWRIVHDHTSSE